MNFGDSVAPYDVNFDDSCQRSARCFNVEHSAGADCLRSRTKRDTSCPFSGRNLVVKDTCRYETEYCSKVLTSSCAAVFWHCRNCLAQKGHGFFSSLSLSLSFSLSSSPEIKLAELFCTRRGVCLWVLGLCWFGAYLCSVFSRLPPSFPSPLLVCC